MKIVYFRGKYNNFGDELNLWMWPKLLPGFFDEDDSTLFIGIGSTISDTYPPLARKIVFGAGYVEQYNDKPDISGGDWHVYFVRGPRTAAALGLPPEASVGDAGILLRTLVDLTQKKPERISFIPHWESFERGDWERVCKLVGVHLLDPRLPVDVVIEELMKSKMVIAEAMHGAIIADAFRIPWVPLLPLDPNNREKWHDWAEALRLTLAPQRLLPSTLSEAAHAFRFRPKIVQTIRSLASSPLKALLNALLARLAAWQLRRLAAAQPMLSDDAVMESVTQKMLAQIERLKRDFPAAGSKAV